MTGEQRESLQRACGIIEGAYYASGERAQKSLDAAVEIISDVLNKDADDDE